MSIEQAIISNGAWLAMACLVALICIRKMARMVFTIATLVIGFGLLQHHGVDISRSAEEAVRAALGLLSVGF